MADISNQPSTPFDRLGMDEQFLDQNLETAWTRWKCLVCGYVYEGSESLTQCPRCGNTDPDKFADVD